MSQKITASDYLNALGSRQKKNKYGAKKTTVDGITFDSKKESKRWGELKLLERSGDIADLRRQVPIELQGRDGPILTPTGRQATYRADFVYFDRKLGVEVIEDSKGDKPKDYLLKKAILAAMNVEILET